MNDDALILESYVLELLEIAAVAGLGPLYVREYILNRVPARIVLAQLAEAGDHESWCSAARDGGWLQ
jgi:hypothetical protein